MAATSSESDLTRDIYSLLTGDEDARVCRDIPESACREQPRNFLIHVISLVASKTGDRLASPKLVLSWLMTHLGAPAWMLGLLVPLRETLSLLPQLFVAGYIRAIGVRKWFWVGGSLVQGIAVMGMAFAAVTLEGPMAGGSILALLAFFSVARGICSVAEKDVLGKTAGKNRRGMATGYASSIAGAATIVVGLVAVFVPPDRQGAGFFGILLVAAGVLWLLAAGIFSRLKEYRGATEGGGNAIEEAIRQIGLIRRDRELRRFLLARSLLLSTALAAPLATADNRASYVAVSNTFIGVMLLAGGAFGGLASAAGPAAAILALSVMSLIAAAVAWRLQEVQ